MKIFDITGKEIATLVNELQNAGSYTIRLTVVICQRSLFLQNSGRRVYTIEENVPHKIKRTRQQVLKKFH
ncbi:MAG: hypothetical protein IPG99_08015 [Ignavibacteria bacterium]|nr:hypothetical protein [Ignavibacteria bacterium]